MAKRNSITRTSNKRVTAAKKAIVDPIIDAHMRLRAAGEDDVAYDAAAHDFEIQKPTTKRGADLLAARVRHLKKITEGDYVTADYLLTLSDMLARSQACRRALAARSA